MGDFQVRGDFADAPSLGEVLQDLALDWGQPFGQRSENLTGADRLHDGVGILQALYPLVAAFFKFAD